MNVFFSRKRVILLAVMLVLVLIGLMAYFGNVIAKEEIAPLFNDATQEMDVLADGQSCFQEFVSPESNMDKITVRVAFGNETPESGELLFKLSEKDGPLVFEQAVDLSDVRNNAPLAVAFEEQKQSLNKAYLLEITAKGLGEEAPVTLMGGEQDGEKVLFLSVGYITYKYPVYFLISMLILAVCLAPGLVANGTKGARK